MRAARIGAWRAVDARIAAGVRSYDRARDLPRLLPLLPGEIDDCAGVIDRLDKALKRERALGQRGHWAYDLSRHFALKAALTAERAAAGMQPQKQKAPPEGSA